MSSMYVFASVRLLICYIILLGRNASLKKEDGFKKKKKERKKEKKGLIFNRKTPV